MTETAEQLPEYNTVMEMYGVGEVLAPQLIAEIGDTRRFHNRKAITAFAGLDASPYQSGTVDIKSRSISKRGTPYLRRTLFLVIAAYLKKSPVDELSINSLTKSVLRALQSCLLSDIWTAEFCSAVHTASTCSNVIA